MREPAQNASASLYSSQQQIKRAEIPVPHVANQKWKRSDKEFDGEN
jgi:hypothetical protein